MLSTFSSHYVFIYREQWWQSGSPEVQRREWHKANLPMQAKKIIIIKKKNTKRWKRELYILNSTVSSEIHCTVHCTTFYCAFRKLLYKSCAKASLLSLKTAGCTEPSTFPKVQFPITPIFRPASVQAPLVFTDPDFTVRLYPTIITMFTCSNYLSSWWSNQLSQVLICVNFCSLRGSKKW